MSNRPDNKKNTATPEDKVAKGEDQFMFGQLDAEHLNKIMPGLAESFITSSARSDGFFHKEYISGFISFIISQKKNNGI